MPRPQPSQIVFRAKREGNFGSVRCRKSSFGQQEIERLARCNVARPHRQRWLDRPYRPVGKRGLQRPDLTAPGRRQLVGLLTRDGHTRLEEGAQIVLDPAQPIPMKMVGHVTSSYQSVALGRPIALALLEGGHDRMGETVWIPMPDRVIEAEVTGTVFYDPDGDRLKL